MREFETIINTAFDRRADIDPRHPGNELKTAVECALAALDCGELRVAEKKDELWVVNEWAKKAVLLSFMLNENDVIHNGFTNYYDKVASKFKPG